ncbi:MAG: hypothetical protein ABGW81_03645 [Paracoccaceae bacterium]
MKNVLLTTTALVAFAGAAAAGADLSLSGSSAITYDVEAGTAALSASAAVGASFSTELNNGMVATLSAGDVLTYSGTAWAASGAKSYTASLATGYGTLSYGAVKNAGYNADGSTLSLVAGMNEGVAAAAAAHDVRIDAAMGGFSAEISFDASAVATNAIALSGSVAGADVAFATDGDQSAMTAAISLAGASVGLAYATDGTNNSVGVSVSYALTSDLTVSGSSATNSEAGKDNHQALKFAYASDGVSASLAYDVDAKTYAVATSYTANLDATAVTVALGYDGSDVTVSVDAVYTAGDLTVNAGGNDNSKGYLDARYNLGGGAAAFASYANAADLGPNKVAKGTFVGVSLAF